VTARVWVTALSTPSRAALAMAAYKRLRVRAVWLPSGPHPWLVRAAGFEGRTVPAMDAGGRSVQGTLAISRTLDELVPERPLFPAAERVAVEEAERWGNDELQDVPRRIFRWGALQDQELRLWVARDVAEIPAPELVSRLAQPFVERLAQDSGAGEASISEDVRRLPGLLDHADSLIAAGTIGAPEPNAADFQIFSSLRVMLDFKALPSFEHRPCATAARRVFPEWAGEMPRFEIPGT
jgi:glutathione S-transferase